MTEIVDVTHMTVPPQQFASPHLNIYIYIAGSLLFVCPRHTLTIATASVATNPPLVGRFGLYAISAERALGSKFEQTGL